MQNFLSKIIVFLILLAISGCFFNTKVQRWQLSEQAATSLSLSRDGQLALIATSAQGIALWDLLKSNKLAEFGKQDPNNNTVIASKISDNKRYAITATSHNFAVWDLSLTQSLGLWALSDGAINDVDIANDGQQVVLALTNRKALYINLATQRRLEFLAHQQSVNSIAISPNGQFVLSGGNNNHAYLWSTQSGQILRSFAHQNPINLVSLQREGRYAFTSGSGDEAYIWQLDNGKKITTLSSIYRFTNYTSARFSDNGNQLVTGTSNRRVEYWHTQTGANIERLMINESSQSRLTPLVILDVAINEEPRIMAGISNATVLAWVIDREEVNDQTK